MLFQREYVFVEIFLQLFICKVDVELLKPIDGKVLKAKDVQHTHKGEGIFSSTNSDIDFFQDPAEKVGIETHGGGVT